MSGTTTVHQDASMISPILKSPPTSFLHLPLEIRLKIYSEILCSHPATHIFLAQGPLQDQHQTYKYHPPTYHSRLPQLLPHKLPTSLLQTCRAIYLESRHLPFTHCLFSFTSQYHSALYCTTTFLSALAPWQRESIRSIEIQTVEFRYPFLRWDLVSYSTFRRAKPGFNLLFAHIENLRFVFRIASSVCIERLRDDKDEPSHIFTGFEGLKTAELAFGDDRDYDIAEVADSLPKSWSTNFEFAMRYCVVRA